MIQLLPDSVYTRISAGEVIVSPAAAVKELLENAADAGATAVTVEIAEGGKELIRVTDNGSGIPADELPMAITQHATSKIQDFEDVYGLRTLGFRGEALASMAQVSRLSIASRVRGSDVGARLNVSGGSDVRVEPAGVPEGTTVRVEDLFYNVPARLRFLKSAAREGSQVTETVRRMILSRPDIAIKYVRSGKVVYHSNGSGEVREAAVSVYGTSFTEQLLELHHGGSVCRVSGAAGKPSCIFRNSQRIDFFINGRYVQSKALQQAYIQGYGESLLHGHYPMGVVHLTMEPDMLDVNVHPGKLTVMLYQEEAVLEDVMAAARETLGTAHGAPFVEAPDALRSNSGAVSAQDVPTRVTNFWQAVERGSRTAPVSDVERQSSPATEGRHDAPQPESERSDGAAARESAHPGEGKGSGAVHAPGMDVKIEEPEASNFGKFVAHKTTSGEEAPAARDIRQQRHLKILGTAFSAYIVCEAEGRLFFVDQHAARERLTYEEMLRCVREGDQKSQLLLIPIVRTLSAPDFDLFQENARLLGELGLSFEPFGELTIRIFSFPVEIGKQNVDSFLADVAHELRTHPNDPVVIRERLVSSACRHSVKAGTELTEGEIDKLLQEVVSMEHIPYCPHGRPIAVELTETQLEKSFRRKV